MNPALPMVIVLLAGAAGNALGQGTILWGNNFLGILRAPVYGPIPNFPNCRLAGNTPTGIPAGTQDYAGAPLLAGTGFTMAIFAGGNENEVLASLSALGSAPFRTGGAAGFVNAFTVTDPNRPPGTTGVYVQFRVWDNQGGVITSWAQVLAAGGTIPFGYSDSFTIGPLGGVDPLGMLHPSPQTTGARSFNMFLTGGGFPPDMPGCPVPEPTTWALLATAAGLCLVRRRR